MDDVRAMVAQAMAHKQVGKQMRPTPTRPKFDWASTETVEMTMLELANDERRKVLIGLDNGKKFPLLCYFAAQERAVGPNRIGLMIDGRFMEYPLTRRFKFLFPKETVEQRNERSSRDREARETKRRDKRIADAALRTKMRGHNPAAQSGKMGRQAAKKKGKKK